MILREISTFRGWANVHGARSGDIWLVARASPSAVMSKAIVAVVGTVCSVLAIGVLVRSGAPTATQLAASAQGISVAAPAPATLRRSASRPLPRPAPPTASGHVIPEPVQPPTQSQYARPTAVEALPSAAPMWGPLAFLVSAGALLALAFRVASGRPAAPLSALAMCPTVSLNKSPVKMITNDELAAYLADGYKVLDARPAYERRRIHPKGSYHVEFVKETGAPAWDPVAFLRKQSAAQYAGFFRDLQPNEDVVADADAQFDKDAKLVVVCGQGERSLCLSQVLQWEGGFTDLVCLKNGLQTCTEDQLKPLDSVGTNVKVGYKDAQYDVGGMLGVMAEGGSTE